MKLLVLTLLVPTIVLARPETVNPFQESLKWIDIVNNDPESTWTADQNFNTNLPNSYVKSLMGVLPGSSNHTLPKADPINSIDDFDIPASFDSREQWPHCKSLQEIRDQGNCGSCWAVSSASAFADRLCIASEGKVNIHLSQEELLACCPDCGLGCDGGAPYAAWQYFRKHGIVSGGDYGSNDGCQPYSLKPCDHYVKGKLPLCSSMGEWETPACHKFCTNKEYHHPYSKDHRKLKTAYSIDPSVEAIQMDILRYGPVQASFTVYEDFLTYKKGVYKHQPSAKRAGLHAVKCIGWGVENGTKYWLVQNSWNSNWGDKGLFKILRGTNECGFEADIIAGIPLV